MGGKEKLVELAISFLKNHWLALALPASLFWGIRSAYLFTTGPVLRLPKSKRDLYPFRKKYPRTGSFFIGSYRFIFSFVGSLAGWCCLYILLSRSRGQPIELRDFTGGDVFLFILSLLGLTGHLPQVTYGLMDAIESLAEKAIKKMDWPSK